MRCSMSRKSRSPTRYRRARVARTSPTAAGKSGSARGLVLRLKGEVRPLRDGRAVFAFTPPPIETQKGTKGCTP